MAGFDSACCSVPLAICNKSLHFVDINFANSFPILAKVNIRPVHVYIHDMLCNHLSHMRKSNHLSTLVGTNLIPCFVMLIFDDENHVKPR